MTSSAEQRSDVMFMIDLRRHYGADGKLASRSWIYELSKRGELPASTTFGAKRVWSRRAVLAMDEARFAKAAELRANRKVA